jgi:transcriptional regulator with GAF, ATPase, and Fis domain
MDNGNLHTPKTISPTYGVAPAPIEQPEPEAFAPVLPQEGSLQEQVERFEADLIAQAMEREGSIRGAARRLKMDPATLLRRKKKYESKGLMSQVFQKQNSDFPKVSLPGKSLFYF